MLGVQAYWSLPTLTGTNGHHLDKISQYKMFDFELIHFLISALEYRKHNGPVILFTDEIFYEYLKKLDLIKYWDYIDTEKYKKFNKLGILPENNWTAFKTWLLGEIPAPFVLFDHDNIIYGKIPESLYDVDVRFAHLEIPNPKYYPGKDNLDISNFVFDKDWEWNTDISNTCILYFGNEEFKNRYSAKAIEFEKNNITTNPELKSVQYLFADQQLLIMMLKKEKLKYGQFSNYIWDPTGKTGNNGFIKKFNDETLDSFVFEHTWGFKHTLKSNESERNKFIGRHLKFINDVYPQHFNQLNNLINND